jgi:hypothetical protein
MKFDVGPVYNVLALLGTGISLLLGGFNLAWNIYRDRKPKVRVNFYYNPDRLPPDPNRARIVPCLVVQNLGPGLTRIEEAKIMVGPTSSGSRRKTLRTITAVTWTGDRPPQRLEVAQTMVICFELERECFLEANPLRVGAQDWSGRIHWAPRHDLEKAQANYTAYKASLPKTDS